LTSNRPYRQGLPPETAFEELLAHSGTQFFPDVVEALIELYSNGKLFAEFEEDELERYTRGRSNSRAVEEYLRAKGLKSREKLGMDSEATSSENDGVPVIDLPDRSQEAKSMRRQFSVEKDGRWRLDVAAKTDLGCLRSNNEDSLGLFGWKDGSNGCIVAIADGMGGAAAGEVASDLAIKTLETAFFANSSPSSVHEALQHALLEANQAIHNRAAGDHRLGGMGTTCTALAFRSGEMVVGHVGDSKAFLIRAGEIVPLTVDHTLAAELEHMVGPGAVAPEGASNVLTRCLGTKPDVEIELSPDPLKLEVGQIFVVCSDGLSNMVSAAEIRDLSSRHDPEEACRRMVALARERGGPDNITVQVARVITP
jgi:protein phosphatase